MTRKSNTTLVFPHMLFLRTLLIPVPITRVLLTNQSKTYLRSSMTEERLNNCLLVHVYKEIAEELDLEALRLFLICFL